MLQNISALKKASVNVKVGFLTSVSLFLLICLVAPAMAHVAVCSALAFVGGFTFYLSRAHRSAGTLIEPSEDKHPVPFDREDVPRKPILAIKIGYGLFALVEDRKGAPLMRCVVGIRHQISRHLGFVVPHIPIKVDLSLEPNSYRIMMGGMVLGEGFVWPDDILAIDDGEVNAVVAGRPCKDPTFGMDGIWVRTEQQTQAIAKGYIVVDASTVIATHLNDIAQRNAAMLFGVDNAQKLLEFLKKSSPQLVDSLTPEPLSLGAITAICRELLAEKVPIKDFRRISLAMLQSSSLHSQTSQMVEAIRQEIGDLIVQTLVPTSLPLPIMTLDGSLENLVVKGLKAGESASCPIEPLLAQRIIEAVKIAAGSLPSEVRNVALITSSIARKPLSALLKQRFPDLSILSAEELPADKSIEVLARIGAPSFSEKIAATDANQDL